MVTTAHNEATQRTRSAVHVGSVALIAKPGGQHTGVGRYVHMLHQGLRQAGINAVRVAPTVPPLPDAGYRLLRRAGLDVRAFLLNFPIRAAYPHADVYHLTSQNLASLLLFRRPSGRVVVTVHDIIPYMLRNDRELCTYRTAADRLFDRLAMSGLKRADLLLADSHYTKRCLVEQLGIAPENIRVIYLGIDHERFCPRHVPPSLRERYSLPEDRRYVIYVGSEDPRKNLQTLVRALAELRHHLSDVELIKVGRAHFGAERQRLINLAVELNVLPAIHFLDDVPEDDLPLLYNLADVGVMPSLYEGFGFPVLEALACGTPVVATRATSIPEIAGAAALLVDDMEPERLAAALKQALTSRNVAPAARVQHASQFSWRATLAQTRDAYAWACAGAGRS